MDEPEPALPLPIPINRATLVYLNGHEFAQDSAAITAWMLYDAERPDFAAIARRLMRCFDSLDMYSWARISEFHTKQIDELRARVAKGDPDLAGPVTAAVEIARRILRGDSPDPPPPPRRPIAAQMYLTKK